jgi:hypothetical protein
MILILIISCFVESFFFISIVESYYILLCCGRYCAVVARL